MIKIKVSIKNINECVDEEMKKQIFLFSILWNLFERNFYNNDFYYGPKRCRFSGEMEDKTKELVDRLLKNSSDYVNIEKIYSDIHKYNDKYHNYYGCIYQAFNIRSSEISEDDFKELYESNEIESKIRVAILLVSRIRNNMFHGIKIIEELNQQIKLFSAANEFLVYVLEALDVSI